MECGSSLVLLADGVGVADAEILKIVADDELSIDEDTEAPQVDDGVADEDRLDADTELPQVDADIEVEFSCVGHAVTIPAKAVARTGTEACMLAEGCIEGTV